MNIQQIKFKGFPHSYSVLIGNNILKILPRKIKILCPKVKKIALIIDKNVPKKFIRNLKSKLKNYKLVIFKFQC